MMRRQLPDKGAAFFVVNLAVSVSFVCDGRTRTRKAALSKKGMGMKGVLYVHQEKLKEKGNTSVYEWIEIPEGKTLASVVEEQGLSPGEWLFLAATREEVQMAGRLQMAVGGYRLDDTAEMPWGVPVIFEGVDGMEDLELLRCFQRQHGIPWVIATTQRCVIRELTLEELPDLFALYDCPGIAYVEPLYSYEEELEYQKCYIANMYHCFGFGMWLVFEKESGKLIGRAGLENRQFHDGVELELGYLVHPHWQRQRIATEVCQAIIAYARDTLECKRLNLLVDKENLPSIRLAEKLGFSFLEIHEEEGVSRLRYVLHLIRK